MVEVKFYSCFKGGGGMWLGRVLGHDEFCPTTALMEPSSWSKSEKSAAKRSEDKQDGAEPGRRGKGWDEERVLLSVFSLPLFSDLRFA